VAPKSAGGNACRLAFQKRCLKKQVEWNTMLNIQTTKEISQMSTAILKAWQVIVRHELDYDANFAAYKNIAGTS
jgi:hypothetical protein